jgi:hypothetical protein
VDSWVYLCPLEYFTLEYTCVPLSILYIGIIPSYTCLIILLSILLCPCLLYLYFFFLYCLLCYHFLVLYFWCDTLVRKCLSQQNSNTLEWTPINSSGASCPGKTMFNIILGMVEKKIQSHACVYVWLKHVVVHLWWSFFFWKKCPLCTSILANTI